MTAAPTSPPAAATVPIGPLVRRFFASLDTAGIPWAVLRGSEGLPDHTRYDIDLLVDPARVDEAETLLRQAAIDEGWSTVRIVEKLHYRCCLAISPGDDPHYLPIDFFGRCLHRFYPIADEAFALRARRKLENGVWVVPDGFGAALALLKELMRHDRFKENSRAEVQHGATTDSEAFIEAVRFCLGADLSRRLQSAAQAGDWSKVESLAPELRRAVWSQRLSQLPAAVFFFAHNIAHNLRPPMSAFVLLLGPDGAGKSTIGDRVAERLYHRPFKVCRRFEYNFRLLPELKEFKRIASRLLGRPAPKQKVVPPGTKGSGMNPEHPPLRAMAYIAYYSLDLILGRLLVRKLRGQGALLVFARYFHDYYYQRGYARAPRWFLHLLEKVVPAPDLILYLHRSAEEIYAGKPELDLDVIKSQQQVIQSLVAGRPNAHVVDASGGIDATVDKVCGLILAKLRADFRA